MFQTLKGNTYTDKVLGKSILNLNADKRRGYGQV